MKYLHQKEFALSVCRLNRLLNVTGSINSGSKVIEADEGVLFPAISVTNKDNEYILKICFNENCIFNFIEKQKRIVTIHSDLLSYGSNVKNNALVRFYIAYRLESTRDVSKLKRIISI